MMMFTQASQQQVNALNRNEPWVSFELGLTFLLEGRNNIGRSLLEKSAKDGSDAASQVLEVFQSWKRK
jgi:hypothetical protein